jgi:hypothetical protein
MRKWMFAAVLAAAAVPVSAITIVPIPFSQLVDESSAVVYGRVSDVEGQWTADRHGIDSIVTVQALEYFKGEMGETVTVRTPGGQVGHVVNAVPGAPSLAAGDLVVLFLKTSGPSIPTITGLSQGIYRVVATGGEALVQPPLLDAGGAGLLVRGDQNRRAAPLSAFAAAVRGTSMASARVRR